MQKRDVLNSPRLLELKKRRHKIFLNKIFLFGLGFLIIFLGFIYISQLDKLNVSSVEITGNQVIDIEILKENVTKELNGKYFWIFPKTNIFLYPKNNIKKALFDKLKRIKNITLSIKNNVLFVLIEERKALYTWCGDSISLESVDDAGGCYFLDEEGYVFDEAPYFSGEVYFKFYGNLIGDTESPLGSYFSPTNFKNLISFKNTIEIMKLKPVALSVMGNGNMKMYLSNASAHVTGPEILFKIDADLERISENLQAVITTEPLQTEIKTKYSSLLYIDLRFGNKVYYKFR